MKSSKSAVALLISVLITIISVSLCLAQSGNPQKTASVEGEWEVISAGTDAWRPNIGKMMSISRRGDGYELKGFDGLTDTYSGNETRIVKTDLEDLGNPTGFHGAGSIIPDSVLQQVAGQKVPINESFTLSGDGQFLQQERDGQWLYWDSERIGNQERHTYSHYEIKPGFYTATFKRVSGPASGDKTWASSDTARISEPLKPDAAGVSTAVSGPPPQELSPLQRLQKAHNLNEQGAQYYLNKQWKLAAEAFKAALEMNPDDENIRNNYELASRYLAAEEARNRPTSRGKGGRKALDQAYTNLGTTVKGLKSGPAGMKEGASQVFDNPVELKKAPINPAVDLRNVGKAPLYPADIGNPHMANAQEELTKLQNRGDEMRAKLDKLTDERNQTKDPTRMKELNAKVDQARNEYGGNQFDTYKKIEEMDKLHRTINAEREKAAPSSGAGNQDTKQGQ